MGIFLNLNCTYWKLIESISISQMIHVQKLLNDGCSINIFYLSSEYRLSNEMNNELRICLLQISDKKKEIFLRQKLPYSLYRGKINLFILFQGEISLQKRKEKTKTSSFHFRQKWLVSYKKKVHLISVRNWVLPFLFKK